jgi:hypothetical protein
MTELWHGILSAAGGSDRNLAGLSSHRQGLDLASSGSALLSPLPHLAEIRCTGPDAQSFLHNQLTSDVNHLAVGAGQYSAWCSAKGRMLANFIVARSDAGFSLVVAQDLADMLVKRLRMFVLRARATIVDGRSESVLFGAAGAGVGPVLSEICGSPSVDAMQVGMFDGGWVMRLHDNRYIGCVGAQLAGSLWPRLAGRMSPVPESVWRWLDVRGGLPWITAATTEEFVPQMVGFDQLGGVSFHKGCYPGQEVVARTQYLGKVKRHLYRAQSAATVNPGSPLYVADDPGHPCGIVVEASAGPSGRSDVLAVLQESSVSSPVRIGSVSGEELAQLTPVAF